MLGINNFGSFEASLQEERYDNSSRMIYPKVDYALKKKVASLGSVNGVYEFTNNYLTNVVPQEPNKFYPYVTISGKPIYDSNDYARLIHEVTRKVKGELVVTKELEEGSDRDEVATLAIIAEVTEARAEFLKVQAVNYKDAVKYNETADFLLKDKGLSDVGRWYLFINPYSLKAYKRKDVILQVEKLHPKLFVAGRLVSVLQQVKRTYSSKVAELMQKNKDPCLNDLHTLARFVGGRVLWVDVDGNEIIFTYTGRKLESVKDCNGKECKLATNGGRVYPVGCWVSITEPSYMLDYIKEK